MSTYVIAKCILVAFANIATLYNQAHLIDKMTTK